MSTLTIPEKSVCTANGSKVRLHGKRLSAEPNYVTLLPPGEILAEKLDEMGTSAETLAERTGLPFETIRKIIRAKIQVTPEIANLLERETQIPVQNWLGYESRFRERLFGVKNGLYPDKYVTYCNTSSKRYS